LLDNTFISTETICTKSVFPASDKVFETNYCLTKVALYEIRIISSIQLYIIECNCMFSIIILWTYFTIIPVFVKHHRNVNFENKTIQQII